MLHVLKCKIASKQACRCVQSGRDEMLLTIPFRMRENVPLIPFAGEPLLLLHRDTYY